MASWSDRGFVLASRPQGDNGLIVSVLTQDHGRVRGLVFGGRSVRKRGWFEPGSILSVTWATRTEGQRGRFTTAEPAGPGIAALLLDDRERLAVLASATALLEELLPEDQPIAGGFTELADLLVSLGTADWPAAYVRWEVALSATLGYGLDLSECAATGGNDHLAYVSPKTGRAVSAAAGEPYRDRLLPLPGFLLDPAAPVSAQQVVDGLTLTGYFLGLAANERDLPPARARLLERRALAAKHTL
ncbi:DNA repair protein RecO [Lacibacterium aquatile]|uniref:DNA repair protein RecO n=1 Tax=Lacibacterium aquatile TaxID=1168082 RepID=A0ABW5DR49_9PROT